MRRWSPALALLISCTPARSPAPEPKVVTIALLGALIGPNKSDGTPWDGPGSLPEGLTSAVSEALSLANPYGAMTDLLAQPMISGLEKPEPFGEALLLVSGASKGQPPRTLAAQRDTLTPMWELPPRWTQVTLDRSTRVRVNLLDEDLMNHDPIGTCELGYEELSAALESGHVYQAKVAEQTQNQILFLAISVSQSEYSKANE